MFMIINWEGRPRLDTLPSWPESKSTTVLKSEVTIDTTSGWMEVTLHSFKFHLIVIVHSLQKKEALQKSVQGLSRYINNQLFSKQTRGRGHSFMAVQWGVGRVETFNVKS